MFSRLDQTASSSWINRFLFAVLSLRAVREDPRRLHVVPCAHGDCHQARRRPHVARVHPPHNVSTRVSAENRRRIKYLISACYTWYLVLQQAGNVDIVVA